MQIYGKNSIIERLKVNPASIKYIFVEKKECVSNIEQILKSHKIAVNCLESREFTKKAQGMRTQGLIAEIGDFGYADFDDILSRNDKESPTILFLDNLNDPQNLGAIIRTAACFGNFVLVLPKHDSVDVTEAVLRVAQGGENYISISKVTNLSSAIEEAKNKGYWIGGAVVEEGQDLRAAKLNFPLAFVIGSEGKGIRKGLVSHLDFKLTLPMAGADLSFNASIAAAIFCYEVTRQRNSDKAVDKNK